ncbi:hypothetical protein [Trinickia fusca]|uniref:Uncharacterized protein n=1 Tax=Trinickia fusca TaxID=2419777 RepID=A0A494X490_9BURK|nr:hypothetical protein [Trinickia fusca]RKP45160.1 hypothetical protein D7S89_20195 [Trinickia fusca]
MSTQQAHTLSSWTSLETFEVEVSSPSNRLYRNGRQQVEVTVKLRARNGQGQIVPLSEAEMRSVRLTDYNSGEELPPVPASGAVTQGWGTTDTRNEYEFFPGAREAEGEGPAPSSEYSFAVRYVQTIDEAPKRIGALVRNDDGTVFTSDKVKQFIEALPERLPSLEQTRAVDYEWKVKRIVGDDDDWDLETVDYYYCGLSINGNRVKLREFNVRPASTFQWESANPASELFSFTGFGTPGSTVANYSVPALFNSRKHSPIREPSDGEGIVILIRSNRISQSSAGSVHKGACDVDARDEFGTDYPLRLSFKSSSNRNELVITRR